MITFFFYMAAISLVLAVCAALADGLGRLFPDWLADEPQADAAPSVEAAQATRGTGS